MSHSVRVIARLDIKGPNLVKGIQFEGLKIVGDPAEHARRYYEEGADEMLYMDTVASLYGRNNLLHIVERAAQDIFIPLTVGGGVRKLDDVYKLLRAGADKVAVNTEAVKNPEFIREAARSFGSQCIVVSIEAKLQAPGRWEALTDNGREKTGVDACEWARRAADLGAGELLVTSVDREGTLKGFDLDLTARVAGSVGIPVIAGGGAGKPQHVLDVIREGRADAVALASLLHFKRAGLPELKEFLLENGAVVRRPNAATTGKPRS